MEWVEGCSGGGEGGVGEGSEEEQDEKLQS